MSNDCIRTLKSHIHGMPRYRPPKPRKEDVKSTVRRWWYGRLASGCQLLNVWEYQEGYDFIGAGRWKRRVAIASLYHNYVRTLLITSPPNQMRFSVLLSPYLGQVRIVSRFVRVLDRHGRLFVRPRRRFIEFNSLDEHKKVVQR